MLGSPTEVLEDSSSNAESEMADTEPGGCGSQPGSSRGVVRQSDEQQSNVPKKKKKVDGTDNELSDKTCNREEINFINESPMTKPSTPSTSLISFGHWMAHVIAGLHPSLERAWTKQVIKMTLLGQYRRWFLFILVNCLEIFMLGYISCISQYIQELTHVS